MLATLQPFMMRIRRDLSLRVWAEVTPAMRKDFQSEGEAWRAFSTDMRLLQDVQDYLSIILTVSFTLFVLYLAHRNHRTLERGTRRIATQVVMLAAGLVVATATYFGASHLAWSIIR